MANQINFYRLPQPVVTVAPVAGGSLVAGTTYYYKAVPWRGDAFTSTTSQYNWFNGPASEEVSFTADATNKSVTLTMTNPDTQIRNYHIFRTTVSGDYQTTTHLAIVNAGTNATYTYTDTGTATAALNNSFADDITIDIPLIDIRGYWSERTLPSSFSIGVGNNGATSYISGLSMGLVEDELNGRVIYFTGDARFLDGDGVTQLRYARVKYNNTSQIFFESKFAVNPSSGEGMKISWTEEDIYQTSITDSWGNISSAMTDWDQAGQPVVMKHNFKNYTINAMLGMNYINTTSADRGMFAFQPKTVVNFGQLCRFVTKHPSALYIGNCNSDYGSGDSAQITHYGSNTSNDTIQTGWVCGGENDITGLRWCFKTKYRAPQQGNTSLQPGFANVLPNTYGNNRVSGCTFEGCRAISPGMVTIFNNNNFFDCGQAIEATTNEFDGLVAVNSITNAIRPSGVIEHRSYNFTAVGGGNPYDMWACDTNANFIVNPNSNTLPRLLGTSAYNDAMHWESSPNGGKAWIQYQMGFTITDTDGNLLDDVCVEVFDKDNNPIYADIVDRKKPGKRFESKGIFTTSSSVRNFRAPLYPKVKASDWILSVYLDGRFYGYTNTELKLKLGEKGDAQGRWGSWKSSQLTIPSQLNTGYTPVAEGEQEGIIDSAKIYLYHLFGDTKYMNQVTLQIPSDGVYDGAGTKSTTTDETDIETPSGYSSAQITPHIKLDCRKFFTVNGRIPLLDFNAYSVMKGAGAVWANNVIETFVPWKIRITKDGYETQEFSFTPSGLYEKEFVVALKPQITKFEDDNGNVFDRVDKTNSGTTNLRRKLTKVM